MQTSLRDLVRTLKDLVRTLTDQGTARTGGYQLDGTRGPPALEGTSLTAQSDEPRFVAMVCKCCLWGTSYCPHTCPSCPKHISHPRTSFSKMKF